MAGGVRDFRELYKASDHFLQHKRNLEEFKIVVLGEVTLQDSVPKISSSPEEFVGIEQQREVSDTFWSDTRNRQFF